MSLWWKPASIGNAQELHFWLFSELTLSLKALLRRVVLSYLGPTEVRSLQPTSSSIFLLLTWSNGCDLPDHIQEREVLRQMWNTFALQERVRDSLDGGTCRWVLQTRGLHSKTLPLFVQSCKLFAAIIFLSPPKKYIKHGTGLPFNGWIVLSVRNAPVPLKKVLPLWC